MKYVFDVESKGQISDGSHTFDELYYHRMVLFSVICNTHKSISWKSWLHHDDTMYDDYFIVGMTTDEGDYTYHYHKDYWDMFDVKELPKAPIWDGHEPKDVTRLLSLVANKDIAIPDDSVCSRLTLRVFMGGTVDGYEWRKYLEDVFNGKNIALFNPIVDDWNDEAKENELKEREGCDKCLYVITPDIRGVYSVAEAIDDSNKRPEKTIFCYIEQDKKFDDKMMHSLRATGDMIERNGGKSFSNMDDLVSYLNGIIKLQTIKNIVSEAFKNMNFDFGGK